MQAEVVDLFFDQENLNQNECSTKMISFIWDDRLLLQPYLFSTVFRLKHNKTIFVDAENVPHPPFVPRTENRSRIVKESD